MAVEGYCNCGSIRVVLDETPKASVLCYCDNCRRAGGLSPVNYHIDRSSISIKLHGPSAFISKYTDNNTTSGEPIERQFCQTCGCPTMSLRPSEPGLAWLKASLFDIDDIPVPKSEYFAMKKPQWMGPVQIAHM